MPLKKAKKLPKVQKREKNSQFMQRLGQYFEKHEKVLVCGVDNVSSRQFQRIRQALKGDAVVCMGKNSLIRKVLKNLSEKNEKLNQLQHYIRGNVGFIFTNKDVNDMYERVKKLYYRVDAKIGAICPVDVIIDPGLTGLDPGQTSFFQAVNIQTKITKGQIEIINPVHLIKKGDKVGANEASLLHKLEIKPYEYGFVTHCAYDQGIVYDAEVLDITEKDIIDKMIHGIQDVIGFSLGAGFPIEESAPYTINNAIRSLIAMGLEVNFESKEIDAVKALIENASKVVVPVEEPKKEEKVEKKEEKAEEEENKDDDADEGDFGFDLFG